MKKIFPILTIIFTMAFGSASATTNTTINSTLNTAEIVFQDDDLGNQPGERMEKWVEKMTASTRKNKNHP